MRFAKCISNMTESKMLLEKERITVYLFNVLPSEIYHFKILAFICKISENKSTDNVADLREFSWDSFDEKFGKKGNIHFNIALYFAGISLETDFACRQIHFG